MARAIAKVRPSEIEEIFRKMSPADQREVERRIWAIRMDALVAKLRKRVKEKRISGSEIDKICKEVRHGLSEKRRSRH